VLAEIAGVKALLGNMMVNTDGTVNTVGKLVNTIKEKPTGSIGLVRVTSDVVTALAGSTTVGGVVMMVTASSANIYYLVFSKSKAAIGNIAVANNAVTKTSLI
jgi:hypothetical protein